MGRFGPFGHFGPFDPFGPIGPFGRVSDSRTFPRPRIGKLIASGTRPNGPIGPNGPNGANGRNLHTYLPHYV